MNTFHHLIHGYSLPRRVKTFAAAIVFVSATAARAADSNGSTNDVASMSIEQLMNLKVTILGTSESASKTPAALSVVTSDDIKRSGAMNIPQALRDVPGLDVAQLDSSQWAISSRGFNDTFANKLLVLDDGRQIYTPLFSGVFWDTQEGTLMDDIDRIEVIRGPGATLWGANAVNGVINIISKNAADTQGLLVNGGGGTLDTAFGNIRYGGKISDNAYYRIYGSYEDHNNVDFGDGSDARNPWMTGRAGFRTDWNPTPDDAIMFEGNGYVGRIHQIYQTIDPANPPTYSDAVSDIEDISGADATARWTKNFSSTADLKVQASYEHSQQDSTIFHETREQFDLNLQNEFALADWDKMMWGLEYRISADSERNNPTLSFFPPNETLNFYSAFVQNEIAIIPDCLALTIGSKFEENDYTDFEIEPGARISWTPFDRNTFWGAISRSVRTPSRAEESVAISQSQQLFPGVFVPTTLLGNSGFRSEDLVAYEIGYRTQPFDSVSFDIATFYNDYKNLRSVGLLPGSLPPVFIAENNLYGSTYGAELSATWRVTDWWRLTPSYTLLQMRLHANRDGLGYMDNASVNNIEGSNPQNQFSIHSAMDFPHGVTFDTELRYVDSLPAIHIESYIELDARLAWQITKNVEVSIVGQNLVSDRHAEFAPSYVHTENGLINEIPRSVYGKVTLKF